MAELPEFLNETYESILERMLSKIPDDIDKSEGSFIYDALAPVAAEVAQMVVYLNEALKRVFVLTSFGEYLDLKANEFGITRRAATKAKGQVIFTGAPNTIIPAGTRVSTEGESAIVFYTLVEATIGSDGTATVDIEAEEPGVKGNVVAGAIKLLLDPVDGVTAVTNLQPTTGGTDVEDDESLRQRILAKVRNPATSGNVNHYKQWALEVEGVGEAKVFPQWQGPGTVKVVIVDSNKQPATPDLITKVAQYIEAQRPVGVSVTVESAKSYYVDVRAKVVLDSNTTLNNVKNEFLILVTEYFSSIALNGNVVSITQIGKLLLSVKGVIDYSNLLLNNQTSNILLADDEIPLLGNVELFV